ncbi:MAG TPA: hypothetical protein VGC07_10575 [Granulicella sp.]
MGHVSRVFCLALLLSAATPAFASSTDAAMLDPAVLAQLESRADHAHPREQAFLYTQLVSTLTDVAGRQMLAGDTLAAYSTLQKIRHYAELIHLRLTRDAKRVINAQMLMHQTTRHLGELVHRASYEDRPPMEDTLKQLTKVEDELLTQVFDH